MLLSQTPYPRVISMRPFIVKQLDYDLTPVAGLALVGHHLNRLAPVFKQALDIKLLPSSPTLRQRMDARAEDLFDFLPTLIERLLSGAQVDYGVLPCGWLALDVDTFAMYNGDTAKDGMGRTYTGVVGYCPLAAYLGSHE